jgi:hypothetical protein
MARISLLLRLVEEARPAGQLVPIPFQTTNSFWGAGDREITRALTALTPRRNTKTRNFYSVKYIFAMACLVADQFSRSILWLGMEWDDVQF